MRQRFAKRGGSGRAAGLRASCLVGLALSTSGCFLWTTSGEGDALRADVDAHAARLERLEQAQNAQLEQLKQAEAKAQDSIAELERVIERATSVVQRNSADVTVQVSELQTKLAVMEGRLAELQYALESLKSQTTSTAQQGTSGGESGSVDIPADKNEHYAAAYRAYTERDYVKARTLFRAYIDRYKSDTQADNAQYWIGASYLVENRPATALAEFRKVISDYRDGDAVDEALLDMAEAFYRLKSCNDAKTTLETLIKTQTKSPLLEKAKQKLNEVKKAPKGYCQS